MTADQHQAGTAAIIMAAGKSTRMKSRVPKTAHKVCGRPMTRHVIDACKLAGIERIVVVIGHEADLVREALGDDVEYAVQSEQLGTGHAAQMAQRALGGFRGVLAVLPGDTPLIRADSIGCMVEECRNQDAAAMLLTADVPDPGAYGRIVRGPEDQVEKIVEARDARPEILAIQEICTSMYAFNARDLFPALKDLSPENRQREYYLTDVIGILSSAGAKVGAVKVEDYREVLGINTRVELADATAIMRIRLLEKHMLNGVTIIDPGSVYIDAGVEIGPDTVLYPGTILEGETTVGCDCVIGPDTQVADSRIADNVTIVKSLVTGSEIGTGSRIGPFSNLRRGAVLGNDVRVGDFVEIKNSLVGENVSLAHMTYIGDAEVGARTNIGAGTITCNFDGKAKHRTVIGKDAFIGSHTTLNAPVTVGDGAFVGSGSVITRDVAPDALAIARARQEEKENWAKRRRENWKDSPLDSGA